MATTQSKKVGELTVSIENNINKYLSEVLLKGKRTKLIEMITLLIEEFIEIADYEDEPADDFFDGERQINCANCSFQGSDCEDGFCPKYGEFII